MLGLNIISKSPQMKLDQSYTRFIRNQLRPSESKLERLKYELENIKNFKFFLFK